MHTNIDLQPLHRQAVQTSVDVLADVTHEQLSLPTPCSGWTLDQLVAHMTVQHLGFAASARGMVTHRDFWDPGRVAADVAADPVGVYTTAAQDALDAFADGGVLQRPFALPEFGDETTVPGSVALAMHFVDYVAHGWDVARTLARPFTLPDDVSGAALAIALGVPDDESRHGAHAVFGPAVRPADGATDLDRFLAHLGRTPEWAP